ncbi:hypothetical protein BJ912DRAFT_961324 [Pholiota molesta]|nr:hypothetical protein BJ912DRAFT_961324 [Pholiota molesta]
MTFQSQYNSYGFLPLIPYYSSNPSQSYYDDGSSSSSGSPSLGLVTPPEGPLPHFMRPSQTEENYYSPFPSTEPGDFQYFAPSGTGSAVQEYDVVPALDFMHDNGEAGAIFTPLTNAYPPASPYCSNYGNPHQADGIRHTYPQNFVVAEEQFSGESESGDRQRCAFPETGSALYVDPVLSFAQEKQEAGLAIVRPIGRKSIRKLSMFECGLTSTIAPHPPAAPQYAYPNYDGANEPTVYEDPYALAGMGLNFSFKNDTYRSSFPSTGSDAQQHIMSTGM